MNRISRKTIIWLIIFIGATIVGTLLFIYRTRTPILDTRTVKNGTISQIVSVTGRVKPSQTVNLGFEKSGRIQGVYVNTGARVMTGALLAELDSSAPLASQKEAQAVLDELKRGARPEEIAVKEAELAKYEQDLTNAYDGIIDIGIDAFSKADDALHAKMTGIFSGFKTSSYKFTYQICDSQLDLNAVDLKYRAEMDFDIWRSENTNSNTLPSGNTEYQNLLTSTKTHLEKTKSAVESVSRTLTLDCTIANTLLDTYRTNINTARTNINTILATINTKDQTISSLVRTIKKTKDELTLLKAGSSIESITAQEARVESAKGEIRKYKIYAPISGTITTMNAKVGEFANTATPLIGIISDSSFEVESNVPEADIAKIHPGNKARITLDAYGSDTLFEGSVSSIDPGETIVDNIPTYKVTLHFDKNSPLVKSGMTANIDIETAKKEHVLVIPQRSVLSKESGKFVVRVNANTTTTETPITTGIHGSDGTIELTSGLRENDVILFSPK